MPRRLPPDIRKALAETGLPYEHVDGSKHTHLIVCGKRVAVLAKGAHSSRHPVNHGTVRIIRKLAQEHARHDR